MSGASAEDLIGELDSYLSHCSEFPSLGGGAGSSSSSARSETSGLHSVNMEHNTAGSASGTEKRKIDSESPDCGYVNSPSKIAKIEAKTPGSPASLGGSGLARRTVSSDNLAMMSGGSVKLEVKPELEDSSRLLGLKSGGLGFPVGSGGPEDHFLMEGGGSGVGVGVGVEQMMTPGVEQKDKQKTNTAAKIRVALEASGLAGNLTPEDLQTLKRLNEIAKSTGLSQEAKSMEASQLLKNNPNVSRLLLKLRTEKNIISKPGEGGGVVGGPGGGAGLGPGLGAGQYSGQSGPSSGLPPGYSSNCNYPGPGPGSGHNNFYPGPPHHQPQPGAQWVGGPGPGYYRPGMVQPGGHLGEMSHQMGGRMHPDLQPGGGGGGGYPGMAVRGGGSNSLVHPGHPIMMERLPSPAMGPSPPKTMYMNRQTGMLMQDYPPGPGMMGPRSGGFAPGGVPPPYINPGGFHPGHSGHPNMRRMMIGPSGPSGPSGPYDMGGSAHRTNSGMYPPMVHTEFDNSFPGNFRDFRENMVQPGGAVGAVRPPPPPHTESQLRARLTVPSSSNSNSSSSPSLGGGSELANRLIHGKPGAEHPGQSGASSYDYFTNGNSALRTESEALFDEIDNSQFDYFNSLDTHQDQSSQNYTNLENNDTIANQYFDTWKSSSNTNEVRSTMLRKLSTAIESNQEISGVDASKLAGSIENKAFAGANSETTYMHSIAQHLAKIFSQNKAKAGAEESPDSTSWPEQTNAVSNSSPDSSQTFPPAPQSTANPDNSHFPSDTTRHCFQEHLDTSELSDLMTDSTSSPMSSMDSNFQPPNSSSSHTNVIMPRGARRLSGKQTNSSHQPHSVDSGIGSPRSIPLYSPTTPITPKTSSSPSVSLTSENSPEK